MDPGMEEEAVHLGISEEDLLVQVQMRVGPLLMGQTVEVPSEGGITMVEILNLVPVGVDLLMEEIMDLPALVPVAAVHHQAEALVDQGVVEEDPMGDLLTADQVQEEEMVLIVALQDLDQVVEEVDLIVDHPVLDPTAGEGDLTILDLDQTSMMADQVLAPTITIMDLGLVLITTTMDQDLDQITTTVGQDLDQTLTVLALVPREEETMAVAPMTIADLEAMVVGQGGEDHQDQVSEEITII